MDKPSENPTLLRISSSLSPLRKQVKSLNYKLLESDSVDFQVQQTVGNHNEESSALIYQHENEVILVYNRGIFRFKMFVIVLLYFSRSILETKHVLKINDSSTLSILKSLYNTTFLSAVFAFAYISGKSFIISRLTFYPRSRESNENSAGNLSKLRNIIAFLNLDSIMEVTYKSIVKYFLPGFAMLYFIQPFSYYLSREYPRWTERITLSPINFYLDSLDRIISRSTLDFASNNIKYFPQVLIYIAFFRIICFPVTELTRYIIECSFGNLADGISQEIYSGCYNEDGRKNARFPGKLSLTDFPATIKVKDDLLSYPLISGVNSDLKGLIYPKSKQTNRFMENNFTFKSLFGVVLAPTAVILMLYYYKLGEFSMLILVPFALPTITFSLAGHLSPTTKVQISLALTYLLLILLLVILKAHPLKWKLCLIFLLGITDSQFSTVRSQYYGYYNDGILSDIINPTIKSVSLFLLLAPIIYLTSLNLDNMDKQTLYMNKILIEELITFLMIILSSHPIFHSELCQIEKTQGRLQIKKENRILLFSLLILPVMVRITPLLMEGTIGSRVPMQVFIIITTVTSIALALLSYNLISTLFSYLNTIKMLVFSWFLKKE
ncbi:putative integral membrane protein [Cryptosporidium felis]|nr:putative integral membrane protein [Cryptosporidium felis]